MAKFFRHSRSRRSAESSSTKESGLSDKTNFPLLSSKWVRGPEVPVNNTTNFSARRLLCFAGDGHRSLTASPPEYVKPDPKAASPPQDVASTWMQMGSDGTTAFDKVDSSSLSRAPINGTHQRDTTTIQKMTSRSSSLHSSAAAATRTSSSTSNSASSTRPSRRSSTSYTAPRSLRSSRLASSENASANNKSAPGNHQNPRSSRFASHSTSRTNIRNNNNTTTRPTSNMKRSKNALHTSAQQSEWRSAVDPKSGRTYYYNVRTRETQWRKPMELASPEERKEMQDKEKKQKDFFAAMEANILKQMATGQVPGTPSPKNEDVKMAEPPRKGGLEKPRMVRTISGMNDQVLKQLVKRVPSLRASKMTRDNSTNSSMSMDELGKFHDEAHLSHISEESMGYMSNSMNMSAMEISLADINYDMEDADDSPMARQEQQALSQLAKTAEQMTKSSGSAKGSPTESPKTTEKSPPPGTLLKRPTLIDSRRNTCGTIYVGSTMSAPDKDATIKCVCGVYRAHIQSAAKEERHSSFYFKTPDSKYRIFNDRETDRLPAETVREDVVMEDLYTEDIPTLDEITNFYRDVFRRAQMESDCIIMSLIYVERLIKNTDGALRPRPSSWRSLLFSCMILSSKVWDDLSMWNADFSQTCPSGVRFSLQRINELELAVLNALDYKVKVPASEYAKYYFLLRSMLIKSGLGGDDMSTMTPLDVEGAKKLEQVSSNFQSMAKTKRRVANQDKLRSKSMGDVVSEKTEGAQKGQDKKANLEQLVKM